jgi:hypothetical protein
MRPLVIALVGCASGDTGDPGTADTDTTPPGLTDPECEETVYFDASVRGRVMRDGVPAVDAVVRLEERFWDPGAVHGSGETDPSGQYDFVATGMPIIEGCWGWATGFYIVAEQDGLYDDWGINSSVTSAWLDGTAAIDLSGIILQLE